jgi:hypothetical protein
VLEERLAEADEQIQALARKVYGSQMGCVVPTSECPACDGRAWTVAMGLAVACARCEGRGWVPFFDLDEEAAP